VFPQHRLMSGVNSRNYVRLDSVNVVTAGVKARLFAAEPD